MIELRRWLLPRLFWLLFFAGITYWNFKTGHAIAGAVILSVVLSTGIIWLRQPQEFKPFRVHIRPLEALIFDHKMTTDEQVKALDEASWDNSLLTTGVRFTMLKSPYADGSGLTFWDDSHVFST